MVVAALLIADVECPQTPLGGLERIDPGCGSLTDGGDYAIIPFGKNQDGVDLIAFVFLIPNTPVAETLAPPFYQTVAAPGSFFSMHNAIIILIQKPAQPELLGKPITVSYFPDTSVMIYLQRSQ